MRFEFVINVLTVAILLLLVCHLSTTHAALTSGPNQKDFDAMKMLGYRVGQLSVQCPGVNTKRFTDSMEQSTYASGGTKKQWKSLKKVYDQNFEMGKKASSGVKTCSVMEQQQIERSLDGILAKIEKENKARKAFISAYNAPEAQNSKDPIGALMAQVGLSVGAYKARCPNIKVDRLQESFRHFTASLGASPQELKRLQTVYVHSVQQGLALSKNISLKACTLTDLQNAQQQTDRLTEKLEESARQNNETRLSNHGPNSLATLSRNGFRTPETYGLSKNDLDSAPLRVPADHGTRVSPAMEND